MQTKTTRRCHLIPVRTTVIKKTGDNECWQGHGETGTLHTLLVEISAATMDKSVAVPPNIKKYYHVTQQFRFRVFLSKGAMSAS